MQFTIGRDIECDLSINSDSVSFHHLIIKQEGDDWYIIDNDSSNGTFLNTKSNRIFKEKLKKGDILYLANYKLSTDKIIELIESTDGIEALFDDKKEILIGRDPNADTLIDKPNISWHHAKIIKEDDGYYLYDLNSTNGSFVNHEIVTKRRKIYNGDEVTLGIYSFIFKEEDGHVKLINKDRDGIRVDIESVSLEVTIAPDEFGSTKKTLLDNISFTIYAGEMVGIMGLSGAGKTTLLNILSGDLRPTIGEVYINNRDLYKNYDSIKNFIGYVPQDDIIHPELTVYEALYYSSKLRLSKDLSDDEINRRVNDVLEELGIAETKDILIGSPDTAKGISGGQRKRVNIAMELLANPEIIFLDEPTSGLSSVDTRVVMDILKRLSDSGKTVILTIHQPSLSNYKKMDSVIILTKGELAYFGANYPQSITFFNDGRDCKELLSDPDNALLGLDRGEKNKKNWSKIYRNSKIYEKFVKGRSQNSHHTDMKQFKRDSKSLFLSQLLILSRRYLTIKLKDRLNSAILLIQSPIIAILLIFLFAGDGYSQYKDEPTILLFILIISAIWFGVINSVREIVSEKSIYKRERMFGLKIFSYVLSKFFVLTILSLIQVTILVLLINYFVPLEIDIINLIFLIFLMSLSGLGIGLLLSTLSKSSAQALAFVPIVLLPMIIFAGGMIAIKDMPTNKTYIDAYRISMLMPTRWALEEVLREYDNYKREPNRGLREPVKANCDNFDEQKEPNLICEYDYNVTYWNDVDLTIEGCEGRRCIEDKYINLIGDVVWRNTPSYIIYIILLLYIILPIVLTITVLKFRRKRR
jgi:ABC-type multidrug transport system ATPase subunit